VSETTTEAAELPRTVPLDPALEYKGKVWDELALREPSYGELLQANKRGPEADLVLVSIVTGIPEMALQQLPASAMLEAVEMLGRFLAKRVNPAGATSPPR
jgi:hypothetical protein